MRARCNPPRHVVSHSVPHAVPHAVLIALTLLTTLRIAHATGLSFDACTGQTQCADGYACYFYSSEEERYLFCLVGVDISNCYCLPITQNPLPSCTQASDCADARETCAEDNNSNKFCASCTALTQEQVPFNLMVAADDNTCDAAPTRAPNPSPTPVGQPDRHLHDFCGFDSPKCLPLDEIKTHCLSKTEPMGGFNCQPNLARCECVGPHILCNSSTDCPQGNVCATDVHRQNTSCISCLRVGQDVFLSPLDDTARDCKSTFVDASAQYPHGPNGFELDSCRSDAQCQAPRACLYRIRSHLRGEEFRPCPDTEVSSCACWSRPDRTFCASSDECVVGELCATYPKIANPTCISAALVQVGGLARNKVLGNRALPTPTGEPALSQDACRYDWDCASPRRCHHVSDTYRYGECAGREPCVCERILPMPCEISADCDDGETCAKIIGSNVGSFCVAASVVTADRFLQAVGAESVEDPEENPVSTSSGLTGDDCKTNDDCIEPRICRHITEAGGLLCKGRRGCTCELVLEVQCEKSSECVKGEQCVEIMQDVRPSRNGTCRSEDAVENDRLSRYILYVPPTPTPSPTPEPIEPDEQRRETEPVCIDASAIDHLPQAEKVFETHRRATVLCDSSMSCATRGHVVVWRDQPMMMQTYCERVGGCQRKIIAVNSPKMKRGLRIPSRTNGLMFTAFAARFASRWEERVLTSLVHIGL